MALATTCPQCKTSFKVVPDQLKLRRGMVRCGMCQHVFSGIDFLRYVDEGARKGAGPAGARGPATVARRPDRDPAPADQGHTDLKTAFFLPETVFQPTAVAPPPAPRPIAAGGQQTQVPESLQARPAGEAPGGLTSTPGGIVVQSSVVADASTRERKPPAPDGAAGESVGLAGPQDDGSAWSGDSPTTIGGAGASHAVAGAGSSPDASPTVATAGSSSDASPAVAAAGSGFDASPAVVAAGSGFDASPGVTEAGPATATARAQADAGRADLGPATRIGIDPATAIDPAAAPPTIPAPAPPTIPAPAPPTIPAPAPRMEASAEPGFAAPPEPAPADDGSPPAVPRNRRATDRIRANPPLEPAAAETQALTADTLTENTRTGTTPAGAGNTRAADSSTADTLTEDALTEDTLTEDTLTDSMRRDVATVRASFESERHSRWFRRDSEEADAIDYFGDERRVRGFSGRAAPLMWVAYGVLSLLLALQLLMGFAPRLFELYPNMAQPFATLLSPWRTRAEMPRNLKALSIESFELAASPTPGVLTLSAVLRNDTAAGVKWPAMELSLTDGSGALLVRKVILPDDYLKAVYADRPDAARDGLSANAELPLRLALEARDLTPAGYSVTLFYP